MKTITEKEQITYTEISYWMTCRWKHHLGYRIRLQPFSPTYGARQFGHDMHRWYAMLNAGTPRNVVVIDIETYYDRLMREDVLGYQYPRYKGLALGLVDIRPPKPFGEFIDIERPFTVSIENQRGYAHPQMEYSGKVDGFCKLDNCLTLYEMKTTGRLTPDFISTLQNSWQPKLYLYAGQRLYNHYIDFVLYEIVNTHVGIKLKKKQTVEDYVDEVRQYVIDRESKYRLVLDGFAPDMTETRAFLWSMAEEIRKGRNIYKMQSQLNCRTCMFNHECVNDDLSGPRRETKHVELI